MWKRSYLGLLACLFLFVQAAPLYLDCGIAQSEEQKRHENERFYKLKGKHVEFMNAEKYRDDIDLVRKMTNINQSERMSTGVTRKANIRVNRIDINGDGQTEILSYIMQEEWCGQGGGLCTFLIFQKNEIGHWVELLKLGTYEDVMLLDSSNNGYHDLAFRDSLFDSNKTIETIVVWRFSKKRYNPYLKKIITTIDHENLQVSSWEFDSNKSQWRLIKETD
ncbi:MAG: hypothetical protein WC291_09965 [Thermodesulfovibrionales bacterium]|jgi:hypothetical protein